MYVIIMKSAILVGCRAMQPQSKQPRFFYDVKLGVVCGCVFNLH